MRLWMAQKIVRTHFSKIRRVTSFLVGYAVIKADAQFVDIGLPSHFFMDQGWMCGIFFKYSERFFDFFLDFFW